MLHSIVLLFVFGANIIHPIKDKYIMQYIRIFVNVYALCQLQ